MPDMAFGVKTQVLLVDDNEDTRLVVESMLEFLDLEPDIAPNGMIAVEKAGRQDYAVVLMDIEMPEMDGLEATKAIRTNESASGSSPIPIIGMSGHGNTGVKALCQIAGMNDYIHKPFLIDQLEDKLRAVLGTLPRQN